MKKKIVIIPTYNEIENITAILTAVFTLPETFDVLIVDDNSPDGTGEQVAELQNTYGKDRLHLLVRKEKAGLGTAYIHGFKWALEAGYTYLFEMDADFSHNPEDLLNLLQACEEKGADLAIGSRYVTGVNVVNWPMGRVLMSWGASRYVRLVTGLPVEDATAGFKCYHRRVLETIDLDAIRFVGYAFQIEMKFKTWLHGFTIVEVPIIFTDRTKGTSKMSSGIFSEALFGVLKMKFDSYFKSYLKKP